MQYPSFPLSTPFGRLSITPLGTTSLLAHSMESHGDPFSIHHVPYTVEIRLIRPNGIWAEPRDHSGLLMRRPDADYKHSFPSDAAMKAVRDSIFPLLIHWAEAHSHDLALAEAIHLAIQLQAQEQEVQEAENGVTEARQKRDALRTSLDALQSSLDLDVTQYATL